MDRRCVVSSCRNYWQPVPWVTYYRIPEDPTNRQKWIDALDLSEDGYVCCEHFNISDFTILVDANNRVIKKLKENVLPSNSGKKKTDYKDLDHIDLCEKLMHINFLSYQHFANNDLMRRSDGRNSSIKKIEDVKEEIKEEVVVKEEYEILDDTQASDTSTTDPAELKKVPEEEYFIIEVPDKDELLLEQLIQEEKNRERKKKDDDGTDNDGWDTDSEAENTGETAKRSKALNHARFHKGRTFDCKFCKTSFRTMQAYLSHMRLSHPCGHACCLCASTFSKRRGLQRHINVAHVLDNRPVPEDGPVCEGCNVKFVSEEVLDKHMITSHKNGRKTKKTPGESRVTQLDVIVSKARGAPSDKDRPSSHRPKRVIKVKPPPPCTECGKQLPSHQALFAHLRRLHPNSAAFAEKLAQRKWLCDVCGKGFSNPTHLKEHKALHSLGRFPCTKCDRSYETVQGLSEHKRSAHSGVLFACSICKMTFSNEPNRRRHEKYSHRTKKLEECSVCGKKFRTPSSKNSHEQHVHFFKPWPKRTRTEAAKLKRRRAVQIVIVEESDESQVNSSEQGLSKSQPKHSRGKRKRQIREEDGTCEE